MKNNLATIVLLISKLVLFTACSATVSSNVPDVPNIPSGDKPATPGAPGKGSPYTKKVASIKNGVATEYAYAEVMELTDGKTSVLRFFTIPPRGLCNTSTFSDSSFYQSKFSYLSVIIDKVPAVSTITSGTNAKFGKRGDDFPEDSWKISGDFTLTSSTDDHFTGWLNLKTDDGTQIQGNFDVVGCNQTHNLLKKMKLDDVSLIVPTRNKNTGGKGIDLYIEGNYSNYGENVYNGYRSIDDRHSLKIWNTKEGIKAGFSGMAGGSYVGAGNTSCTSESPGPVTAEVVGNRVYFNGSEQRPFFCKYQYEDYNSSGFIDYNPTTGVRTIELKTNLGTFVGEF